jgi:hypothetical protein
LCWPPFCASESVPDPKPRVDPAFEDVASAPPGQEEPPRPDHVHGDHREIPIESGDDDRIAHAQRVNAPASQQE